LSHWAKQWLVLGGNDFEFFEGCESRAELADAVLAEGLKNPVTGGDAKLLNGGPVDDGVTDLVVHDHEFEDGEASFVADAHAFVTTHGGVEVGIAEFLDAEPGEFFGGGRNFILQREQRLRSNLWERTQVRAEPSRNGSTPRSIRRKMEPMESRA